MLREASLAGIPSSSYLTKGEQSMPKAGRLAVMLCAAGIGLAAGSAGAGTLNIGTVTWVGFGPFYVAEALDLYKKYGVTVKLKNFSDNAMIPFAMSGHSIDGGLLTYDQVIGAVAKGQPFRVAIPIDYSKGGDAIISSKDITQVRQLKGQKVAYNPLSPSDFLLSYALQKNGLSAKDIHSVNVTPEGVPAVMATGRVAAGVTYEPNVSQSLKSGKQRLHVLFSSKDAPGLITDVLVFDEKTLASRGSDIRGLVQGYLDGMAYIRSQPEAAAKIIGKAMGVSPAEVKSQWSGVYNVPLAEMMQSFTPGRQTTSFYTSGRIIGDILKSKGQIKAVPAIERTYDLRIVQALNKSPAMAATQ